MNTKDFVVLPWGKSGNSVKLKYKNAQELRMEKVQLELENREMEKKLRELDSTVNKEMTKRESSGYHWKSGQAGKLGNRSHTTSKNKGDVVKENVSLTGTSISLIQLSAGKVKLKLLKEQIQEPVKQPLSYKMTNSSEEEKPKIKGKVCGQCENKAALLVCLECGEDYCSGCFAKIHQKGALKLHRTTLLQEKSQILSTVLDVAHRFITEVNPDKPKQDNHCTKEINANPHKSKSQYLQGTCFEVEIIPSERAESTNQKDELLCEGSFDEEASAKSFQEVLNQWRTRNHDDNEKQNSDVEKPGSVEACEVQTNLKIWREPLEIEFKEDSLSYVEKLWLKKHRRELQDQRLNVQPNEFIVSCKTTHETQFSPSGGEEESDVEETKVQCPELFMPVEELKIERPEPSLKIVELGETYEEEFEEPGGVVPYKVELPDADSKQSWILDDYQKNNFPYENGINQHCVFTKEKIDFFKFCLTSNPSYCKDKSKARTSKTNRDNIADPDVCSPVVEKIKANSFCEKNSPEENVHVESSPKPSDSCTPSESKGSLPSTDLEEPSIKEKFSQDIKESLDLSNLHERPNVQDAKTSKSLLLLQEIALRSRPTSDHYQGLERFSIFDKNERIHFLPSHGLECSSPSTRSMLAGDKEWIPEHSLGAYADNAVALDVLHSAQNPSPSRSWQRTGQTSPRPSTANLPLSNFVTESSSCFSSPHLQPRKTAARSLSRAASEISEIEYIDVTDPSEAFVDNTADQQTLDSLEKELKLLKHLADPSEKLHSLTSEELPAFSSHSQNKSEISVDFLKTSHLRDPCGDGEESSFWRDTEIPSWLTLSESSTDEDEEDFRDKQHVITLP